jgi:hypothetical protein
VSADAQTRKQRDRCIELYTVARRALESLSEERLNLCFEARESLNECRGELERFDSHRMAQPVIREGGAQ